jgi:threonine dehydratase
MSLLPWYGSAISFPTGPFMPSASFWRRPGRSRSGGRTICSSISFRRTTGVCWLCRRWAIRCWAPRLPPPPGFRVVGVVPQAISRAKDEKLRALDVELIKVDGKGNDLLTRATEVASERGAYFVHPHLDPRWTDGYQSIAAEVLQELPDCGSLVFPVGGGGLLMGLTEHVRKSGAAVRLFGCEPHSYPKYARFEHARTSTVADGLILERPHPQVQERILEDKIEIGLVAEADICTALKDLFLSHALVVEPSSAIAAAAVRNFARTLPEPVCLILTGGNISREDHARLMSRQATGG